MNLLNRYKISNKEIALASARDNMLNELIERYRPCMYAFINAERNKKYRCTGAIRECQECIAELIDEHGMLKILKEIDKYSYHYGPRELGIITGHCKGCVVKDYEDCRSECLPIILNELRELIK